jgi:HD-like signal output (HDOD) protein
VDVAAPEQTAHYPSLDELVENVTQLHPLAAVSVRVLALTEGEHFSATELATVIASDQALTAKMLRLANSAYYGFPRRINTAREAVVLLGLRAVRSATLVSTVIDAVRGDGMIDREAFWRYSVTVGMLAEVSARNGGHHQHQAFTAGVLHNIGRLALDQQAPNALRATITLSSGGGLSLHQAQHALLGYTEVELGAALAERWNFPEALVGAIAHWADEQPPRGSLAEMVSFACAFADSCGLPDGVEVRSATEPQDEWLTPAVSASLERLGGIDGVFARAEAFVESTLLG